MSAYLPVESATAWVVAASLAMALLLGLALTRLRPTALARAAAWMLAAGSVLFVERFTAGEPAGFRMLAVIGVLLYGMKAVVSVESLAAGASRLTPGRWLAFASLWPGMRPGLFARAGGAPLPGAARLLVRGALWVAAGTVLVALARPVCAATRSPALATVVLLPGLSLILHFGVFSALAGAWRLGGVDCAPLFRAPLLSTSLAEFWGRRWNLAFSEMAAIAVHRPVGRALGPRAGILAAFLFSGLLHELAISVPVKAGFGLPTLYFLLHGGLVLIEKEVAGKGAGRSPWIGRLWTAVALVAPLPVLFHPAFLMGVVRPLIGESC